MDYFLWFRGLDVTVAIKNSFFFPLKMPVVAPHFCLSEETHLTLLAHDQSSKKYLFLW